MIIINLDRKCKTPIYKQLISKLRDMFDNDIISHGYIMPSTRLLAEKHGISRSTVIKAYEELWALGYLDSRSGSYSIVRKKHDLISNKDIQKKSLINWEKVSNPQAQLLHESNQGFWSLSRQSNSDNIIKMSSLSLDLEFFPVNQFRKCLNKVMMNDIKNFYNFLDPQGFLPLREFLAQRMQIHGINVSSSEIMITNGSQNSINLILSLLSKKKNDVLVEDPTYFLFPPLLKAKGLNPISIPMKSNGMDIGILKSRLKDSNPSFLYTIPNFHNPTGITTSHRKREKILDLCEKYNCPIIEDAFEEEMKYFGKVPLPIKSMDKNKIVIYISSVSKVFFPSIRLGWIAADKECIERLVSLKIFSDISSNLPVQAALAEFGSNGFYDMHIKKIHRIFRKRMVLALKTMKNHIKFKNVSWIEPSGGFIIWITMKNANMSDSEIFKIFLDKGVRVFPGGYSYINKGSNNHIRISISNIKDSDMVEGIKRINNGLLKIYEKN